MTSCSYLLVHSRAESLSNGDWHSSQEFQEEAKKFHDKFAKPPPESIMKPAKQRNKMIVEEMRDYMRKEMNVVQKVDYTGSSFESLKIEATDLEFDVMVYLKGSEKLIKDTTNTPAGYTQLLVKPEDVSHFKELKNKEGLLSSDLVQRWFFGVMEKARAALIEKGIITNENLTLHASGPAVMMKVFKEDGSLWFTTDMVPTFELKSPSGNERYVAKAYKEIEKPGEVFTTWRRSSSVEEKDKMKSIDKGSGCRRMCVRMLKAMKAKESTFAPLCTYFLKTTLMNLDRDEPNQSWEISQLGECFIRLLKELYDCLRKECLPNHFLPEMNLLESLKEKERVLCNIANRLQVFINKKEKLLELFRKEI